MIPPADTVDKCRPVVLPTDPAIEGLTEEAWSKYIETGEEKHLPLKGAPRRYLYRPLDLEERTYVVGVERDSNAAMARLVATRIGLVAVDEPDGETRTDLEADRTMLYGMISAVPVKRLCQVLPAKELEQQAAITVIGDRVLVASGLSGPLS